MYVGQEKIREDLMAKTEQLLAIEWTQPALKEAAQKWLDTKDDGNANAEATKEYVAALQANIATVDELAAVPKFAEHAAELKAKGEKYCDCDACKLGAEILSKKDYLSKKSVWIFGGDGWAYDIGYGGLDHILASGRNVKVLVMDTEVYSNTGGQCSKSTPRAAVAKFATNGKPGVKKDLGLMAMTYGNVYVASVALGAKDEHTLKAFVEAEAYDGPALIIAYSHCISHGINMAKGLQQQKAWVDSGRVLLYRYNPDLARQGKNPLIVEGKGPKGDLRDVLLSENRFKLLAKTNKEGFEKLLEEAQKDVWHRWNLYQSIAGMGADKPAE